MDWFTVAPLLAIVALILTLAPIVIRDKQHTLQKAWAEGLFWGTGFFFAFSAEVIVLATF